MLHETGQMHYCGCGLQPNSNGKRITTVTIRNAPSATGRRRERLPTENGAKKKKSSAKPQPDFGAWFRATEPRRICYEIREGANQWHDLAYVSSYLHDAKIWPSLLRPIKGRLRIGLERDCWELFEIYHELVSVSSVLEISPVLNIEWRFQHAVLGRLLASPPGELYISDFLLEEGSNRTQREGPIFHIMGALKFWSLSVQLGLGPWKIALRDTKSPVAPVKLER